MNRSDVKSCAATDGRVLLFVCQNRENKVAVRERIQVSDAIRVVFYVHQLAQYRDVLMVVIYILGIKFK